MSMPSMLALTNKTCNHAQQNSRQNSAMDLADRLKTAMRAAGVRQIDLATATGSSRASVSKWLSGGTAEIRGERLIAAAKLLGVSPEWLATGKETKPAPAQAKLDRVVEWNDPDDLPEDQYVFVRRYALRLSAGNGGPLLMEDQRDRPTAFRAEWIAAKGLKPADLACVYASGDSMAPRICDGDSLLIDMSPTARRVVDGRVYAIRYGDEARVKRLFRRPDGCLIIRSDNAAAYPDIITTPADMDHIAIIGRVIWIASETI